jgi:hypothetical protein
MATDAQTIARELALALLSQHWKPMHLSPSRAQNDDLLVQHCLKEAIALREADQAGLSLELLVTGQRMGMQSPWLLDNQARALVDLGRRQAAWEVWQHLSDRRTQRLRRSRKRPVHGRHPGNLPAQHAGHGRSGSTYPNTTTPP